VKQKGLDRIPRPWSQRGSSHQATLIRQEAGRKPNAIGDFWFASPLHQSEANIVAREAGHFMDSQLLHDVFPGDDPQS
jgi:hypothetical protein